MSIQYDLAAALIHGSVSERTFTLLNDPVPHPLIRVAALEIEEEMTRAHPGKQSGEVEVREFGGASYRIRLDKCRATGDTASRADRLKRGCVFAAMARLSDE